MQLGYQPTGTWIEIDADEVFIPDALLSQEARDYLVSLGNWYEPDANGVWNLSAKLDVLVDGYDSADWEIRDISVGTPDGFVLIDSEHPLYALIDNAATVQLADYIDEQARAA